MPGAESTSTLTWPPTWPFSILISWKEIQQRWACQGPGLLGLGQVTPDTPGHGEGGGFRCRWTQHWGTDGVTTICC